MCSTNLETARTVVRPVCARMVGVAQLVEHQVVALRAVGSSPITHPIFMPQER